MTIACASIAKYGRHWAIYDPAGNLVCLCVYRKGAREVAARLDAAEHVGRKLYEAAAAYVATRPATSAAK